MSDGIFTRQRQRVHCWQTAPPPLTDVGDKQEQLKGEHTPRKSGWEGLKMTDFCFHQTFVIWFPTCRESRSWDLESETQRSVFFFPETLEIKPGCFFYFTADTVDHVVILLPVLGQGSVFGPSTFNLLLHDFPSVCDDVDVHTYADDTVIHTQEKVNGDRTQGQKVEKKNPKQ